MLGTAYYAAVGYELAPALAAAHGHLARMTALVPRVERTGTGAGVLVPVSQGVATAGDPGPSRLVSAMTLTARAGLRSVAAPVAEHHFSPNRRWRYFVRQPLPTATAMRFSVSHRRAP